MTRRRLTALSDALMCNYTQMALLNSPLISLHPPALNLTWVPSGSLGLACGTRAAVKLPQPGVGNHMLGNA